MITARHRSAQRASVDLRAFAEPGADLVAASVTGLNTVDLGQSPPQFGGQYNQQTAQRAWWVSQASPDHTRLEPSGVTFEVGTQNYGQLDDYRRPDAVWGRVTRAEISPDPVHRVRLIVDGTGASGANDLWFRTTARSNATGVLLSVQFWDWTAGAWVDSSVTGFSLKPEFRTVDAKLPNEPRFVSQGNVRSRVRARLGSSDTFSWHVEVDQASWIRR